MLNKFLKFSKCEHDAVNIHNNGDFCPDCGERIQISWYITRCTCCNARRKAYLYNGQVLPMSKFCSKCGQKYVYVEKKHNVNYFDYEYAVIKKEVLNDMKRVPYSQVWVEKEAENKKEELKVIPLILPLKEK